MNMILFVLGILTGFSLSAAVFHSRTLGALCVRFSDEREPYLFLRLTEDVESIRDKKQITLKIELEDEYSQN